MTEINDIKIGQKEFEDLIERKPVSMTTKHFEAMCECAVKGSVNVFKGEGIHNKELIDSIRGIASAFVTTFAAIVENGCRENENIKTDSLAYVTNLLNFYSYFVDNSRMKESPNYNTIVGLLHVVINELLDLTCPGYMFRNSYFGICRQNNFYHL